MFSLVTITQSLKKTTHVVGHLVLVFLTDVLPQPLDLLLHLLYLLHLEPHQPSLLLAAQVGHVPVKAGDRAQDVVISGAQQD